MQNEKIFTPEAFGAVADGITDDSAAVAKAIAEASVSGGTVQFAKDAVYFIKNVEGEGVGRAGLNILDASGVTLKGDNTTIRLGEVFYYFSVINSSNITIDGFVFEMYPHVAFRGRLQSVSHESVTAVIKTDYEIPLENGAHNYYDFENGGAYAFAMPDDQWRTHLFLRRIEKNNTENEYTVWFDTAPGTRRALRRVAYRHCDIMMPTPNMAHIGCSFLILNSADVYVKNCNIKEAPQFVGAVRANVGEIYFENIKMCVEKDQTIPLLGWRDGYHCKDNRGAIHWKNCEIGRLYDDAFNISCSNLYVIDQPEPDVLSLKNFELDGEYYEIKAGDILSVYNLYSGVAYCEALKVKEVVKQEGATLLVRLEKAIPAVDLEHTRAIFDNICAANSTIEDCHVTGTVRIRCPITVKNTKFENLLLMWTENELLEGPVPHDMLFENCSFKGVYPTNERYLENYFSFRTTMIWPGKPGYKLKNIRLVDCEYDEAHTYIEDGNDVQFITTKK